MMICALCGHEVIYVSKDSSDQQGTDVTLVPDRCSNPACVNASSPSQDSFIPR